jgi:hypothetical protein
MIPRPTVLLLLLLACLLVSGAGKYPWLAVAGIYAIPVAWNLVAIQPAAAPAVAGAVATVAIVWVWQSVIARVRYRREVLA